eukprot:9794596-Lingulodinium_polyedra.AAC.1
MAVQSSGPPANDAAEMRSRGYLANSLGWLSRTETQSLTNWVCKLGETTRSATNATAIGYPNRILHRHSRSEK